MSVETVSRETSLEPWFVTGLIEGIGSFTYSRSGKQLAVYFGVKSSSSLLLGDLNDFFGVGAIYRDYFRVQRRNDLAVVVDHFDRFPLRSKRATYEIWREMVIAKQDFRKPNRERLEQLATELSQLNR